LALPSPGLTPLCLCHLGLDHSGPRRIQTAPRSFATCRTWLLLGTQHLSGPPPGNAPNTYSKPGLFNPWGFITQDAWFGGAWPPVIVAPGALPHGPTLPCLGHQAWTPLCNISAGMT
jgi:hypothetical protein